MKTILDTIKEFETGKIDKVNFIKHMHEEHHAALFDYASHLSLTNIKKIEIEDGIVIMTSRDRGVRICCSPKDFRIAPIESLNFFDALIMINISLNYLNIYFL